MGVNTAMSSFSELSVLVAELEARVIGLERSAECVNCDAERRAECPTNPPLVRSSVIVAHKRRQIAVVVTNRTQVIDQRSTHTDDDIPTDKTKRPPAAEALWQKQRQLQTAD